MNNTALICIAAALASAYIIVSLLPNSIGLEDRSAAVDMVIDACKPGNTVEFSASTGSDVVVLTAKCTWIKE